MPPVAKELLEFIIKRLGSKIDDLKQYDHDDYHYETWESLTDDVDLYFDKLKGMVEMILDESL